MTSNRMTARQFLAREIQLAREAKGIEREDLAEALYVSLALVRAWEAARRVPQPDVLPRLEATLGANGYLKRLRDDLVKAEPMPEHVGQWREIEVEATSLLWFQPLIVPGILQTPEYSRDILVNGGRQTEEVEAQIAVRQERQKVLAPENALMCIIILDVEVLYRTVGNAKIMHEQLRKLVEIAKQPNINIQIVRSDDGAHPGLAGGFGLAAMDGHEYVYVDDAFSGDVLEDPEDVVVMRRVWLSLTSYALPARQSMEILEKAMEGWAAKLAVVEAEQTLTP